jgi:excinuclease ABC subunit A
VPSAPTHPHEASPSIVVVGAREHNLKGLDLRIPRGSFTVITGLSGSGKSSLAFDTLYQEGQRRFLESLSAYARQFLGSMEKPKVERVEGLSPTLCIDQKTVNRNPRSTVGTVTEILDHLRLLMARLGTPHCPRCDRALSRTGPGEVVDRLLRDEAEAWITVMAPIVRERKGEYRKELAEALAQGWLRARVDGALRRLDEDIPLGRYEKHTIELVVDRVRARPEARARLVEAIEQAAGRAEGTVSLLIRADGADDERYELVGMSRSCPEHGVTAPELVAEAMAQREAALNAPLATDAPSPLG